MLNSNIIFNFKNILILGTLLWFLVGCGGDNSGGSTITAVAEVPVDESIPDIEEPTSTPTVESAPIPLPTVGDPIISSPSPVAANTQIGISVAVDGVTGTEITYEWSDLEGMGKIIAGQGTNGITYKTPELPGTYQINVKVSSAGGVIERSVFITVDAPPTFTPTPTDTPTPAPSPTPLPPIACNHPSVTKALFPQLADVENQYPFYGPLDEPLFTCHGVYDRFHSEQLAVKLTYKSAGKNGGFWGFGGFSSGYDATGFEEICFWAYAELPSQAFRLQMKDLNNVEKGVNLSVDTAGEWTEICTSLSKISEQGVQLSRLENVNLNFNTSTQDATIWVDDFQFR